jgi:hypothetical protein
MSIQRDVARSSILRRWLSHLALLAFAIHALVPAGYMPDLSRPGDVLKVVICSIHGFQTVELDGLNQKAPAKSGATHQEPCAFSSAGILAFLNLPDIDIAPFGVAIVLSFAGLSKELPPARAGPALGARAPPQLS